MKHNFYGLGLSILAHYIDMGQPRPANLAKENDMPVQSGKSALAAKYGSRMDNAVKKHAKDPTRVGQQRLPPGINNGKAKLVECGFGVVSEGKKNAGEFYFRAAGVVMEPHDVSVNGERIRVAGRQTSIMEMVCDTTDSNGKVTSHDAHVDVILNYLRQLGGDEYTADAQNLADLEELAKGLETADPPIYFAFATSLRKGREYRDPKTKQMVMGEDGIWENWYGAIPDYQPPSADGAVQDNSSGPGDEPPTDESVATTEADTDADGALTELAAKADGGDKASQKQLKAFAIEAGVEEKAIEDADNWAAVVGMIQAVSSGGEPSTEEEPVAEEAPWQPDKGDLYLYGPVDKNGKPVLDAKKKPKKVEVEVIAVSAKKQVVDLVNNADKKTKYLGVKWDALESIE